MSSIPTEVAAADGIKSEAAVTTSKKKKKLVRVSQQFINHLLANEPKRVFFAADEEQDMLGPFALFMDPEELQHSRAVFACSSATFQGVYDMLVNILEQYRNKGYAMVEVDDDDDHEK